MNKWQRETADKAFDGAYRDLRILGFEQRVRVIARLLIELDDGSGQLVVCVSNTLMQAMDDVKRELGRGRD